MTKRRRKTGPYRPAGAKGYGGRLAFILTAVGLATLAVILAQGNVFRGRPAGRGGHAHPPAPHGGLIVSLGPADRYHVEAVLEAGGGLKLYTLGADLAQVLEVPSQTADAQVTVDGPAAPATIRLLPMPQPGDRAGWTSRFMAKLPPAVRGRAVTVTVPALAVAGERFRLEFASAGPAPAGEPGPAKLYLEPGGRYTRADIAANGGTTAAQKYPAFGAAHDAMPRPGDRVCPVTRTKAHPDCTWVVGGKTYAFCCPPCIDEFVTWARDRPDQVKEPHQYVKDE